MNKLYVVKYRRRREGKTDYHKRIKLLTSNLPVIRYRKGSKTITAQVTYFDQRGDKTLIYVNSSELQKYGWKLSKKNIPASYLTGILLAKKNKDLKEEMIVDFGIKKPTKGSACYAFLKGIAEGGIKVKCSPESFTGEERITGKHISNFFSQNKRKEQFSKSAECRDIEKIFLDVKNKIIKG